MAGLPVEEHARPVVLAGGDGGAQGDGHGLEAEALGQLAGHALIALVVQLSPRNVGVGGLDAEDVLGVLLVGDAHVHIPAQLGHGLAGLLPGPQLLAVVQVAGDGDALGLGDLDGLLADGGHVGAQGGGDAGKVEPVRPLKDLVPVEVGGGGGGDGGAGPVIDDLGGPLAGALLQEVDAHPVAAPDDVGHIHAVAAHLVDGGLSDVVGGELGDESGVQPVIGQGDGHVGLAAAVSGSQRGGLNEPVVALGGQTEHDLAEGNHSLSHFHGPPSRFQRIFCTAR